MICKQLWLKAVTKKNRNVHCTAVLAQWDVQCTLRFFFVTSFIEHKTSVNCTLLTYSQSAQIYPRLVSVLRCLPDRNLQSAMPSMLCVLARQGGKFKYF